MTQLTAHYIVFMEVSHDGNSSPDELAQALGMAMNDHHLEVTAKAAEGMTGTFRMERCLGVYSGVPAPQMKDFPDGN